MSSYVNIFGKFNGKFAMIGSYSRSSSIYQLLCDTAPYEKTTVMSQEKVSEFIDKIEMEIAASRLSLHRIELDKEDIIRMNGPISEKLEALKDLGECASNIKEDIEILTQDVGIFNCYREMFYLNHAFEIVYGIEACAPDEE